uniref:TTF-type domain-containing protein n=1 Tax=Nicotiana tabacum TaxID=4097 RepID=A0A1S4B9M9_TOBAC|nr:PREDICTED: uncharacterized protein LOC107805975 [Nicotiana tabacum]
MAWLEYSVKKDAAFCLCCCLFKNDYVHGSTGDSFTKTGFKAWNKASKRLDLNVGKVNSLYHTCFNKMLDLSNQSQSIQVAFDKQSEKQRNEHRIRVNVSIDVVRILVDESKDISHHEQMTLSLQYVYKKGQVNKPFIGLVRVHDTSAKSLKEAILSLLMKHSLSLSKIRGQGYDGASNMQGEMNGVVKKHKEVETFFAIVANVLTVIGASFKRRDQLRDHHAKLLEQLLESGKVLLMSNELSKALQKKEQDIVNAMLFLDLTKERLQQMRDEGWKPLMDEELNRRFDVVSGNLLLGMASLNLANSVANFDK